MGETTDKKSKSSTEAITEWREYSRQNHPYQEIKEKAILDAMAANKSRLSALQRQKIHDHKENSLCYSYISETQKFTEEQIEEMVIITSPLFPMMDFSLDNKTCINIALQILQCGYDKERQIETIDNILRVTKKNIGNLEEEVSYFLFRLSEALKTKDGIPHGGYQDRMDWRSLVKYQDISPEFCEKWSALTKISEQTQPHVSTLGLSKAAKSSSNAIYARPNRSRKKYNKR